MPHAAIRDLTARLPALAEALWRDCMVDAAILSQWVVNVGRREIRVFDWKRLAAAGEFDRAYLQTGIGPEERLRILPPLTAAPN